MNETMIYPEWKNAVEIVARDFQVGDLITFDWIHENFKIEKPKTGTFDDFQTYQFRFLEAMDGFKNELLEDHQIAIANVRGEGYRLVTPKEQTGYAEKKFIDDVRKSVKKAASLLNNIKFDCLDDSQRKQNADAKGRIAAVYALSRENKAISRCRQIQEKKQA